MARTGVEEKPPWRVVPVRLKRLIGEKLGSPVVRGSRVWGSYGPGPSYRLLLEDGRRAFTKALWPESSEFQRDSFIQELRIYRELAEITTPWAPAFHGDIEHGDWHAILLEDLGPKTAPPWKNAEIRIAARGLAELHRSSAKASVPGWIPRLEEIEVATSQLWQTGASGNDFAQLAGLADDPAEALEWIKGNARALTESATGLFAPDHPRSLIHLDFRSDNLRVCDGRLRLFDWPNLSVGPPELDAVGFAQTVEAEGAADCETVLRLYGDAGTLRSEMVTSAAAIISGYFALRAWLPDVPGLPRLRQWQLAQLTVCLRWAARRLGLADPLWLDGIART